MGGGAWWAAVHGVAKSWTRLSYFTFTFHFHALKKEMAAHSSVLAWRIPGTGEPGGLHGVAQGRTWLKRLSSSSSSASFLNYFRGKKEKDLLIKHIKIDSQLTYLWWKLSCRIVPLGFSSTPSTYLLVTILCFFCHLPVCYLRKITLYAFLLSSVKCHYFLKWLSST